MDDSRPTAEELLRKTAQLRIFLGMSAGVGKTYSMLKAAHQMKSEGADVVVGVAETHGRIEISELLQGLEVVSSLNIHYRETNFHELDLDGIIRRKPKVVLIDELAHSNVPGVRHEKRYQDILELLDNGIDVFTTLNVQHLESRKDSVEMITKSQISETVPDSILERAGQVELVDIAPNELLKRLREGKVFLGENAARTTENFFKEDRLTALREIALRITAERVDQDLQKFATVQQGREAWNTTDRLMVAVSHSPYSEKLIRATRRLAYNLEAPWIAVYIDTGISLSIEHQAQLAKNLTLARELKAEVITTTEVDVPLALRRIARQRHVTQIVVGKPSRSFFADLFRGGSVLDRLVERIEEVDVHVVGQDEIQPYRRPFLSRLLTFELKSGPLKYWNTFWFIALIGFASQYVEPYIGYRTVGFIFLMGVMTVGMIAHLGPVIFSAILSAIGWNYFFIPPIMTLRISDHDDIIMCFAFAIVALLLGFLTTRIRFHEQIIREREERTNVLYEVLREISQSRDKRDFLVKVLMRIGEVLRAECGVFLSDQSGRLQFDFDKAYSIALDEKDQAVASWAFQSQKSAGWSTDTLSQAKSLFIPMQGVSESVGILVFTPKTSRRLKLEQENLLYSITRQLSISLERHFLEKRLAESRRLEDSETLHQTLLNSISQEMRTPLTTIISSSSAITSATAKDPQFVMKVAGELVKAGDRLNRVIENLLDMTRLNSGTVELKLERHDIGQLIAATLAKLGGNLVEHKVEVALPEDLGLVRIDFRLMEHAISNLIFNAAAYTPKNTEILISGEVVGSTLHIFIDDQGPGIPEKDRQKVFEKFYRLPGTPSGGTGLGLSIARSIVQAHGGNLFVESSKKGGARFVIALPYTNDLPKVLNK